MKPDERENLADRLLDAGLKQYGKSEPRAGLENRVLANLRAERERVPAPRWWPRAVALAAVLIIAVSLWIARKPARVTPTAGNRAPKVQAPANKPEMAVAPMLQRPASPVTVARVQRKPRPRQSDEAALKLEQFPSTRPLSEQEKLLLAYLRQTPEEELRTMAAQEEKERKDLVIHRLEIKPINIDQPDSEVTENN